MINGKYHFEDKRIVIDIADFSYNGMPCYEVMKMDARTGEELDGIRVFDLAVAENVYNKMVKEYTETVPPLTGKYAKLRDDLVTALAAASSPLE